MKKLAFAMAVFSVLGATTPQLFAGTVREPILYVVQKGDTLWDISERFFKDPFFWPNLWSRNPAIGNPHVIYPGQKLRILHDRIEVVTTPPPQPLTAAVKSSPPGEAEPIREKVFLVVGSEGFIAEKELGGVGHIIATNHDRGIVGAEDTVYTDIGSLHGAHKGDRFSIYSKQEVVTHPLRHVTVGYKIVPLGTLELTELTPDGSRALITESFREISSGAFLLPWRNSRREIPLKSSSLPLSGIIMESLTGNKAVGAGDLVYLDLGKEQGLELGNMLHLVRQPIPDRPYVGPLPQELVAALVVVGVGRDSSTAIIIKSVETVYLGEKVVTVLPQ